jgi:hypothetical protein
VTLFGGGLVMPYSAGLAVQVIRPGGRSDAAGDAHTGGQRGRSIDLCGRPQRRLIDTQGDIVILDGANPDPSLREARRIGVLGRSSCPDNAGASELYAARLGGGGGHARRRRPQFWPRATAIGATTITLTNNDVTEWLPETQLTIDTGANQEPTPVSVLSIDTTPASPLFPVTIAPALTVGARRRRRGRAGLHV